MAKYRGKYPRRIKSVWLANKSFLHIQTNNGEVWHILECKPCSRLPKLGEELEAYVEEVDADLRSGSYHL